MGEHKHNPTAIKAKKGELSPKPKPISKREAKRLIQQKIKEVLGVSDIEEYLLR